MSKTFKVYGVVEVGGKEIDVVANADTGCEDLWDFRNAETGEEFDVDSLPEETREALESDLFEQAGREVSERREAAYWAHINNRIDVAREARHGL